MRAGPALLEGVSPSMSVGGAPVFQHGVETLSPGDHVRARRLVSRQDGSQVVLRPEAFVLVRCQLDELEAGWIAALAEVPRRSRSRYSDLMIREVAESVVGLSEELLVEGPSIAGTSYVWFLRLGGQRSVLTFLGLTPNKRRNETHESESMSKMSGMSSDQAEKPWTFVTNHTQVLLTIARDSDVRIRDIAAIVGITERAAQRIVADLIEAGYVTRERIGRRNHYSVHPGLKMRHPSQREQDVGPLLDLLSPPG